MTKWPVFKDAMLLENGQQGVVLTKRNATIHHADTTFIQWTSALMYHPQTNTDTSLTVFALQQACAVMGIEKRN